MDGCGGCGGGCFRPQFDSRCSHFYIKETKERKRRKEEERERKGESEYVEKKSRGWWKGIDMWMDGRKGDSWVDGGSGLYI